MKGLNIRLDSPLNRTKKKELFDDRLVREWKRLPELFDEELAKYAKEWDTEDWKKKAGLYADMSACKEAICDRDCFKMVMKDGTMNPKAKDGLGYPARFAKRLTSEGAKSIIQSVIDSFSVGMSWQSRSLDANELAQVVEIGF